MDYEKKYKEALERAREWYNKTEPDSYTCIVESIFPELKESEDEESKKWILEYLYDGLRKSDEQFKGQFKAAIAWLEKQKEIDKSSYEIVEKEKYDFVSGQFIECRKSFNEFKEGNSYWFEYIGNDTYIGRSDNILNKKFHITPRQLYRLFTQQHCPKENNMNEETNAPTGYGKYVDECLNEAAKHFFSEGEDKYSVADLFYAGVRCGKSWLEKQGEKKSTDNMTQQEAMDIAVAKCFNEQKVADKVEPKFKVGDTIKYVGERKEFAADEYTIKEICNDCYITTYDNKIPFRMQDYYVIVNNTKGLKKIQASLPSFDEAQGTPIIDIPFNAKDSEFQEASYHIPKGFH